MDILAVTPAHIPALSTLAVETFVETFGYLYPEDDLSAFLHASYSHDALAADIADLAQVWQIVMDADVAVAYLQIGPVGLPHPDADPGRQGELKRIYVRQSHQGKGLGKRLMDVALAQLSQRYGTAPQWIGVWSENLQAQALYAASGFTRVGEYQFSVGKTLDDEFILRRLP